jgi:phage terminase small subunit
MQPGHSSSTDVAAIGANALRGAAEAFCVAYVGEARRSAFAASKIAGLTPSAGHNMVHRPEVQARIRELTGHMLSSADISAQRVLRQLGRIAFSDVRELYAEDGALRHPHDWPDDAAAAVMQVTTETRFEPGPPQMDLTTGRMRRGRQAVVVSKAKVSDRVAALSILAKHFKLVNDGEGVDALAGALADRLKAARARVHSPAGDGGPYPLGREEVVDAEMKILDPEQTGDRSLLVMQDEGRTGDAQVDVPQHADDGSDLA